MVKKPKLDIPVPQINTVTSYNTDVSADYQVKDSYVRYHRQSEKEWREGVDYCADMEDEIWLGGNAKFGARVAGGGDGPKLTLSALENILDLWEKATAWDIIITIQQAESLVAQKLPELVQLFPQKERGSVRFKQVIHDIYQYWVAKRSKLRRPLLRRYWPVTSSDDTNPHLVFRPREKEKYKLRKKRQNDAEAMAKLRQLRCDFENLRHVLELVKQREELFRIHVQLRVELFQQRLYDIVDTSGLPRVSQRFPQGIPTEILQIPNHFNGNQPRMKMKRSPSVTPSSNTLATIPTQRVDAYTSPPPHVAGRNGGEPAPNFLHPLPTRETFVADWDGIAPPIPNYDGNELSTATPSRCRYRPRIGRGGRVCLDRIPHLVQPDFPTIYRAGYSMNDSHNNGNTTTKVEHVMSMLPQPLDAIALKEKIEAICLAALQEDVNSALKPHEGQEDGDGDEVVVRVDDWMERDDQPWGDERYVLGPL